MELRRILLRAMLVALGLAALTALLGVMTAAGPTFWRLVGSCFLTALSIGFMLVFSRAMDNPIKRDGGLAGMAWTTGAFLLCLMLLWSDFLTLTHQNYIEQLMFTLLLWFLCGITTVAGFYSIHTRNLRIAAWSLISLSALTFFLFLSLTWFSYRSLSNEYIYAPIIAFAAFGMIAVLSLVNVGCGDRHYFRWGGLTAAALGFLFTWAAIESDHRSDTGLHVTIAMGSFALFSGLTNLALLVHLKGPQVYVRWATLIAAATCLLCINIIVGQYGPASEMLGRVTAGTGIVAACGILALAVLHGINRRDLVKPPIPSVPMDHIIALCPRCKSRQKLSLDGDSCSVCHLLIKITVEEPACTKCGYLLTGLTSANCPECGTPVHFAEPKNIQSPRAPRPASPASIFAAGS